MSHMPNKRHLTQELVPLARKKKGAKKKRYLAQELVPLARTKPANPRILGVVLACCVLLAHQHILW